MTMSWWERNDVNSMDFLFGYPAGFSHGFIVHPRQGRRLMGRMGRSCDLQIEAGHVTSQKGNFDGLYKQVM